MLIIFLLHKAHARENNVRSFLNCNNCFKTHVKQYAGGDTLNLSKNSWSATVISNGVLHALQVCIIQVYYHILKNQPTALIGLPPYPCPTTGNCSSSPDPSAMYKRVVMNTPRAAASASAHERCIPS